VITTVDFKQNEDRFRLVLKNNPHPMWIYDHQTLQFRDVNPAALAKYGYKREEFLKMKITEIRPKDEVPRLLAEHKRFGMNRKHLGEWKHRLKNGRLIDVEITAYPLFFEGRPAILVQAQDITERKRAQEALLKLAVLEERNRIARDIHDTLAQAFTGILVQLEAAQDVLTSSKTKANSHILRARKLARKSLAEARRSVSELRPSQLERIGLVAAIKEVATGTRNRGPSIRFKIQGKPRMISAEIENSLLRISQEAVTNIIRHSKAKKALIHLTFNKMGVRLLIQDDGKGFNPKRIRRGFGLIGMSERANQIGAKLTVQSKRDAGTKVILEVLP
jgi:PAS domain S-box-containing protein